MKYTLILVLWTAIAIFVYVFTYGMVVLDQAHTQQATDVWGWALGLDCLLVAASLTAVLYHADRE